MIRIDLGKLARGARYGGRERGGMGRRSGQMLPMVSVLLVILIAMSGLVLDGGRIYFEKRRMPNAADERPLQGDSVLWQSGLRRPE